MNRRKKPQTPSVFCFYLSAGYIRFIQPPAWVEAVGNTWPHWLFLTTVALKESDVILQRELWVFLCKENPQKSNICSALGVYKSKPNNNKNNNNTLNQHISGIPFCPPLHVSSYHGRNCVCFPIPLMVISLLEPVYGTYVTHAHSSRNIPLSKSVVHNQKSSEMQKARITVQTLQLSSPSSGHCIRVQPSMYTPLPLRW